MRNLVLGVSDQVRQKPSCSVVEDGWRFEILDLGRRVILLTKALIKCAADLRLFSHIQNRFSQDFIQLSSAIYITDKILPRSINFLWLKVFALSMNV